MPTLDRMWPLPLVASTYVLAVAGVATLGFVTASTSIIVLAALLTLPSSIVAVPAYYVVFGLLAQVPGANPARSTGSGSCEPNGDCQASTTGDPASWFTHATELVGILALVAAALLNVLLLQRLIAARQHTGDTPVQPGT